MLARLVLISVGGVVLMATTVTACCVVDWWTHEHRWHSADRNH